MNRPRLMVLSIDGVPFGLLERFLAGGRMPNLAGLVEQASAGGQGGLRPMRSAQPTVSCVAWSSYMTGCNPGKHGIFGFIDRREDGYELSFPNSRMMAVEHLWEILSKAGKRVFGMNVPATYPPRPVNGVLIGGFLAPSVDKCAYPADVSGYLKQIDYQIDSDAALARKDKRAMLGNLDKTLDTRMEAMFHFLDAEPWDFFHTHIMGTDRINHFLLEKYEQGDPQFAPAFERYYRRIDEAVGRLLDRLGDDTPLLIFSDHGFCPIKQEVQLSRYLIETGWTVPATTLRHPLSIDPARSKAYCLIPGRIFVNLKGREPGGIVPLEEYQQTRLKLKEDLLQLKDPATGEPVIRKVMMREDLYWPAGSFGVDALPPEPVARAGGVFGRAADLIAIPHDGYDLKLGLAGNTVFQRTELEGMHTYHDAAMISRGVELPAGDLEILMLAQPILRQLGVEPPQDMDGVGSAVTSWEN
ncbi:MAG: alkaline phosphatase family protein [Sedimentisphaerales bacterium]|nr:alkaline phosphatase family protein [Sedimentisphaerales bacterium]